VLREHGALWLSVFPCAHGALAVEARSLHPSVERGVRLDSVVGRWRVIGAAGTLQSSDPACEPASRRFLPESRLTITRQGSSLSAKLELLQSIGRPKNSSCDAKVVGFSQAVVFDRVTIDRRGVVLSKDDPVSAPPADLLEQFQSLGLKQPEKSLAMNAQWLEVHLRRIDALDNHLIIRPHSATERDGERVMWEDAPIFAQFAGGAGSQP
jgi:hypothetical protein